MQSGTASNRVTFVTHPQETEPNLGSVFFRAQGLQTLGAPCKQHGSASCEGRGMRLRKRLKTLTRPEPGATLRGLSTWCTNNRLKALPYSQFRIALVFCRPGTDPSRL
jgi:hypothetical protein